MKLRDLAAALPYPGNASDHAILGGVVAAYECWRQGGNASDGWVFRPGGKLRCYLPKGGKALEGWRWAWERLEKESRSVKE